MACMRSEGKSVQTCARSAGEVVFGVWTVDMIGLGRGKLEVGGRGIDLLRMRGGFFRFEGSYCSEKTATYFDTQPKVKGNAGVQRVRYVTIFLA